MSRKFEDSFGPRWRDLTKEERVELIVRALVECGEEPTAEAVEKQFKRETGKTLEEVS